VSGFKKKYECYLLNIARDEGLLESESLVNV